MSTSRRGLDRRLAFKQRTKFKARSCMRSPPLRNQFCDHYGENWLRYQYNFRLTTNQRDQQTHGDSSEICLYVSATRTAMPKLSSVNMVYMSTLVLITHTTCQTSASLHRSCSGVWPKSQRMNADFTL